MSAAASWLKSCSGGRLDKAASGLNTAPSPLDPRRLESIPLYAQSAILAALLAFSGFFSMSETAMMAANRYRLRSAANEGSRGARLALELLSQTDKLLGIILLFNNLVNAAAATLVSVITIQLFGNEEWALGASTLGVTFLILVFAEITPKVIGANHANKLACFAVCISSSGSSICSSPRCSSYCASRPTAKRTGSNCPPRSCACWCWSPAPSFRPSTAASCSIFSSSKTSPSRT
jgi:hypothetical protein